MKKIVASLAALTVATTAQAATQWTIASGGNGHYYEFVGANVTHATAKAAAAASTNLGQQGYLATVTSQGEQDFLRSLSTSTAWIGAEYYNSAWRWSVGPEAGLSFFGTANPDLSYSFWNSGEPNGNTGEPVATISWDTGTGRWNDWGTTSVSNYFIEYAAPGNVPEPAAWAMLISGFGLLGAASRRRRSATVYA